MSDEGVLLIERRGSVEWVTLNRPAQLNSLNPELIEALNDYFQRVSDDNDLRVIVLRGAGRAFCAGLDLHAALRGDDDWNHPLPQIILGMRRCPQPIVALLQGAACGGGFAMALAADIRIAGETARMKDAFLQMGVSGCELGLSYFLPRFVGMSVASELMLTDRFIEAERAYALGLVSRVVPDDDLEAVGTELAEEMLAFAPLALQKTKETLTKLLPVHDLATVISVERSVQEECLRATPNFREGLVSFAEKRKPQFVIGQNNST